MGLGTEIDPARQHGAAADQLVAYSGYPDQGLSHRTEACAPRGKRLGLRCIWIARCRRIWSARRVFNFDFLPTAHFGKSYVLDDSLAHFFFVSPAGPWTADTGVGGTEVLGTGHQIVLAPEDGEMGTLIASDNGPLSLFDALAIEPKMVRIVVGGLSSGWPHRTPRR